MTLEMRMFSEADCFAAWQPRVFSTRVWCDDDPHFGVLWPSIFTFHRGGPRPRPPHGAREQHHRRGQSESRAPRRADRGPEGPGRQIVIIDNVADARGTDPAQLRRRQQRIKVITLRDNEGVARGSKSAWHEAKARAPEYVLLLDTTSVPGTPYGRPAARGPRACWRCPAAIASRAVGPSE